MSDTTSKSDCEKLKGPASDGHADAGIKKLSELKGGDKFAFGGRFFIASEAMDDCDYEVRMMPIDLETGEFGFGEGHDCNQDTVVNPLKAEWVPIDGVMGIKFKRYPHITGEQPECQGVNPICMIVDEFAFLPEDLIEKADISFRPTYDPMPEAGPGFPLWLGIPLAGLCCLAGLALIAIMIFAVIREFFGVWK
jgi:hypothetical protein